MLKRHIMKLMTIKYTADDGSILINRSGTLLVR